MKTLRPTCCKLCAMIEQPQETSDSSDRQLNFTQCSKKLVSVTVTFMCFFKVSFLWVCMIEAEAAAAAAVEEEETLQIIQLGTLHKLHARHQHIRKWMDDPQITENKTHFHHWINEEKKNSTKDAPKPWRTLYKQQLFIFSKQLKLPKVRRGKTNYAEKVWKAFLPAGAGSL